MRRLKKIFLDVASEACGYTKANPHILKHGGRIKVWICLCVERENHLGFRNSQNEEDRKKYCEAKKDPREYNIWLWIRKFNRRWRKLTCVMMVESCLELSKKGLGKGKMFGLVVLKMKVGWRK